MYATLYHNNILSQFFVLSDILLTLYSKVQNFMTLKITTFCSYKLENLNLTNSPLIYHLSHEQFKETEKIQL